MALYQRLWSPGCGLVHRQGPLLRPRQSPAPCQATGGRRKKGSEPEPEPEPQQKPEAPRRGRPRKTTGGESTPAAAAAPPPSPPPPPGGPEETDPVSAPAPSKRGGRKPRASAAAPPTRPAPGPDAIAPPVAPAAAQAAPEPTRRGRGRKASAAAALPAAAEAAETAAAEISPTTTSSSSSTTSDSVATPSTAPSTTGAPGSSLLDPLAFGGGGDVTATQELDAMEDDVPSRLHLGFGDPMHSTDDLTFHHEQELLPTRGAGAAGAGGHSTTSGGDAAAAVAEEDGWTKWRKFKAGTLPEEEMEYYRALQEIDARNRLPDWQRPENSQELAQMKENMDMLSRMVREWEQDAFQDQAYAIHHYQNETGVNRYMNARQLAGYMAQVELEDHQSPDRERMRFSSWARAEHRFAADYDAFNAHLEEHMEDYVIKLPPGAEDAEDIDILDDVLLLNEGDRESSGPATPEDALTGGTTGGPTGVDRWLSGVLPGGTEGSADMALVEDLLAEDAEDDLEAAAG